MIFISHSSKDKAVISQLAADLKRLNFSVWLDEWNVVVGQSIASEIEHGLGKAKFVIVAVSRHAVESRWVDREWKAAYWEEVSYGVVKILPIRLDDAIMPMLLAGKKYADFRDSYAVGLQELLAALDWYVRPTRALDSQYPTRHSSSDGIDSNAPPTRLADAKVAVYGSFGDSSDIPSLESTTREVIKASETAVTLGSRLFDRGNAADCVDLYDYTLRCLHHKLASLASCHFVNAPVITIFQSELRPFVDSESKGDPTSMVERAWTLRYALDSLIVAGRVHCGVCDVDILLERLRNSNSPLVPEAIWGVAHSARWHGQSLFEGGLFLGCAELYVYTAHKLLDHVHMVSGNNSDMRFVVDTVDGELRPALSGLGVITHSNAEAITGRVYRAFSRLNYQLIMSRPSRRRG
jgi:TIR domain